MGLKSIRKVETTTSLLTNTKNSGQYRRNGSAVTFAHHVNSRFSRGAQLRGLRTISAKYGRTEIPAPVLHPDLRSTVLLKQLKQKLAADRGCHPGPLPESGAPVFARNFRPSPLWSARQELTPASASSLLVRMPDGNTWHRHADHVRPRLVTQPATSGATSEFYPAGGSTTTVAASEAPQAASVASCAAPVGPLPSSAPFSRPVNADPPEGATLAQGAPGVATPGSSTPVPKRSTRQRRPPDRYWPG
ncbi:hypothetical protein HPB49_025599 [Dermacentor silvarum]|uniref:Uncharacterized protein n=1 Tax=Dermacentor silvarum TaxID=543639 RepID=A0ACB8E4N1_DERSI|nr:hypothetical protein HPB49_025599 [Dermacentor silvarum]